jgi:hypothetical protein
MPVHPPFFPIKSINQIVMADAMQVGLCFTRFFRWHWRREAERRVFVFRDYIPA